MTRTAWSETEPLRGAPTRGPQTDGTSAYSDRNQAHTYNPIVPGTENLRCIGATGSHLHLLQHTTSHLNVVHMHDYFQLPHPSSAPHHFILPPQLTHPPHPLLPPGNELIDDTSTSCKNLDFHQPSGLYTPWDSLHPFSPNLLPNATCDISQPTLHHHALDPTLFPDSFCPQSSWSTGDVRLGSVDEVPPTLAVYDLPAFPLPDSSHPKLDNASEPHSETLDPSYPCQWTKEGAICNLMVQATRSHMNRHLHAYHGFSGSDARQTRCHWAGCGAMMQQGSIARHMVTCHLQAKVTCPMCFKKLSRQDVISKHQRVCPAAGTWR